jgi:hypothetical protein
MEEIVSNDGSASSHRPTSWHAIDWHRVEQQVRTSPGIGLPSSIGKL